MKFFKYLLFTLTAFLFTGCDLFSKFYEEKEVETGSIFVLISKDTRTITPSISMDITSYDISGVGPSAETFTENSTNTTFTKSGLSLGDWLITAQGKNLDGDVIAQGSGSVTLSSGADVSLTINLLPLSGDGTLTINLDWPSGSLSSPAFEAQFGLVGESLSDIDLIISGDTASYNAESYAAGYYMLVIDVYDGLSPRFSIVKVVRVIAGQNTNAEFSFSADELGMDSVAPVFFSITSGEYATSQNIELSTFTDGATIRYTTNGSIPTETTGMEFTGAISIDYTQTINAIAFAEGYNSSLLTYETYVITDSVPLPTVSLTEGLYYESQLFEITVPDGDYTVVYTTDNSEPTLSPLNGTVYTGALTLNTENEYNLIARTFNTGDPTDFSDTISAYYNITGILENPDFSIVEGTYYEDQTVTISTSSIDASIYYTTDGSSPSTDNGILYSGEITIAGTVTINAIAVKEDWQSSEIISSTYTLTPEPPTASISGGTYNEEQSVTLSTLSSDCSIYYTLDGTTPTSESSLYSDAITIDITETLNAVSIPDDVTWSYSEVSSETYNLQPLTPTFSIAPDSYTDASFTVEFLCDTSDVIFTYTTDETIPVSGSIGTVSNSRFIVVDTTLKVIASRDGWTDSEVLSGSYYPNSSVVTPEEGLMVSNLVLDFPGTSGVEFYYIQLLDANNVLIEDDPSLTESNYTITSTLIAGETYYWKFSIDSGITWSTANSFVTCPEIGDSYGGGIVFYLDGNGGGLIAAEADISTGIQWYNGDFIEIGTTGTDIGTGQDNTTAIIEVQGDGSYAAQLCNDLELNGYTDWFLPSKDELNLMYQYRDTIGGFTNSYYWSSSEESSGTVWTKYFTSGNQDYTFKNNSKPVRPVRGF